MMDDHKAMLEQVFGLSSDSEVEDSTLEDDRSLNHLVQNPIFQSVPQINGLWFCRDFLSSDQQYILLSTIRHEGWFEGASKNQAMRFGDLPAWSTELSDSIRELVLFSDDGFQGDGQTSALPWDLLWREPLFNQLIVNVYEPGEGICAHVDLLRFEDGIAIISLESSCVMHFSRVESAADGVENEGKSDSSSTRVPILLAPGSLVLMSGEARYNWKHEINRKPGFQIWEGRELDQMKRTSITLRKLCPSE
ncbi:hypothetical protein QN277_013855 [Acacia crassicarpa]|uniref:Fe2OG dioxygenase domain-containing protein n=2 Tax=Acacia crassicarpa TaxID=499986 RepID=A0AAE1TEW7_9FABA|nr:hypothetical protein QN277_013855 [Acacia crassicarpa]